MTHTQTTDKQTTDQQHAQAWLDAHAAAILAKITTRPVRTYTRSGS